MTPPAPSSDPRRPIPLPMTRAKVLDAYFLEHRGRLLDLAAFLDRVDRASDAGDASSPEDHRLTALRAAIPILIDGRPDRARRILEALSDPTTDPIPAAGTKGATGAPPPPCT